VKMETRIILSVIGSIVAALIAYVIMWIFDEIKRRDRMDGRGRNRQRKEKDKMNAYYKIRKMQKASEQSGNRLDRYINFGVILACLVLN